MGLFDSSKIKTLESKIVQLEAMLTPDQNKAIQLRNALEGLNKTQQSKEREIKSLEDKIIALSKKFDDLEKEIQEKKQLVVFLEEEKTIQEFGLYSPLYDAMSSESIKAKLENCREQQKALIKNDRACSFPTNWTVNGNAAQGKKMIKDNVKQILRSFNTECESIIDKVKFNNLSAISDRIQRSYEALNKMNVVMNISILPSYLRLKQEELRLVFEYARQKETEKEAERQNREELREQKKLALEIKKAREKLEKEATHFEIAIAELRLKTETTLDDSEKSKYLAKIQELETKLADINREKMDVDYRERNTRAGYVYVISNIGAFGEGVYKIGVTRRLEPLERVNELGDASVPFKFDVHCMIFSEDAPKLELALHQAFDESKLNKVNQRREFFKVPLNAIEKVIRENYNDTFEMKPIPAAEEFRISQKISLNLIRPEDVNMSSEAVDDNDSEECDG